MKIGIIDKPDSGGASGTRPSLLSSVGQIETTSGSSKSIIVTPPATTSLALGFVAMAGSVSANVPTLNGVTMTVAEAFNSITDGSKIMRGGLFYTLSPTIAAQNFAFNLSGGSFSSAFMRMFFLKDAASVGTPVVTENSGASCGASLSLLSNAFVASFLTELADSAIVGDQNLALTNLTLDVDANEQWQGYASAYAATPGTGSQTFTFAESGTQWAGSNHRMQNISVAVYGS